MIRGKCNLPGTWPTLFTAVPTPGELVIGKDLNNIQSIKKVLNISHTTTLSHDKVMNRDYTVPMILVELEVKDKNESTNQ